MSMAATRIPSAVTGQIVFKSDPNLCRQTVYKVCREVLDETVAEQIRVAVQIALHEAVMNAIVHGNQRQPQLTVKVSWQVVDCQAEIEVVDCGIGFQPGQVPDPAAPENRIRPGGRGLAMIRHFVDEVAWNELGNAIRMKFSLRRSYPSSSDSPRADTATT